MAANSYDEKMDTQKSDLYSHDNDLEQVRTVYDDNYHGLTLSTVLVYLVSNTMLPKVPSLIRPRLFVCKVSFNSTALYLLAL